MPYRRSVQILTTLLVLLSTMLMCLGQRTMLLAALSVMAAGLSIVLTDWKGWFRLSRTWANLLALIAVGAFARDLLLVSTYDQLFAVANVQVYLQIILFFQPKTPRVFWQLILLSLGQVVVAAAMSLGISFAVILLLYLLLGMLALAWLSIYREAQRFAPCDDGDERAPAAQAGPVARMSLAEVALEPIELHGMSAAAAFRPLGRSIRRQSLGVACLAVVLSAAIFPLAPRMSSQTWEGRGEGSLHMVGFTDRVRLGSLGEVVENSQKVMRLQFFKGNTQEPFIVSDTLLLRGAAVSNYQKGTWTHTDRRDWTTLPVVDEPEVRMEALLEPMDSLSMFLIAPSQTLDFELSMRYDATSGCMERTQRLVNRPLRYTLGTSAFDRRGMLKPLVPADTPLGDNQRRALTGLPGAVDGLDPLARLKSEATAVLADANIDPRDTPLRAAKALAHHLQSSGKFSYSLGGVTRAPELDPLEDFVSKTHRGHCEYFAGALALMLRGQGIPCRLIIGFKGGEWNPLGGFYVVRQLHAHTWVEAYLKSDEGELTDLLASRADADSTTGEDHFQPAGYWLTLDPTAPLSADEPPPLETTGLWASLRQSSDYLQVLWSTYVVGMTERMQSRNIYEPIREFLQSTFGNLITLAAWKQWLLGFVGLHGRSVGQYIEQQAGSMQAGLLTLAAGWTLYCTRRRWMPWLKRRAGALTRVSALGAKRAYVQPPGWFVRWEALLGRVGMRADAARTPREAAQQFDARLASRAENRAELGLANQIVSAFYRVRFGSTSLSAVEQANVDKALQQLETALADR